VLEKSTEVIQKIFAACLGDRSSLRHEKPRGKKIGVYHFANEIFKLLFACRRTQGAKQLLVNIYKTSPPLSLYPAAERVTFLYYLGRFHFNNGHFARASSCLEEAYLQTPPTFQKHRRLILTYLIPSNLLLGRLPSSALLQRLETQSLAPIFGPFIQTMRSGDFLVFQQAIEANEAWLFRKGLLLTLTFRLRPLIWRALARRTFLLTYSPPMDAESKKAATLDLAHLSITASYVQKRLEGYLPAHPATKGKPPHVNRMLLKAVANSAGAGNEDSTLSPPPGGPKTLRPNEGLVWGNLPITYEHVESVIASLITQGLMNGFIAHSQGRFAVQGARSKDSTSTAAAGWPSVAAEMSNEFERSVPGWVQDHDI
jgi:hypothetical protein